MFSLLLKALLNKGNTTYPKAIELAESALLKDPDGYKREFVNLVKAVR